jgi:Lon protease-like protein
MLIFYCNSEGELLYKQEKMSNNAMTKPKEFKKLKKLPPFVPYIANEGQMLLPKGLLPVLASTPSEMKAVREALKRDLYIGIVQPSILKEGQGALCQVGCVGRITTFSETQDNGYYVILKGERRFRVVGNQSSLLHVNYDSYIHDTKTSGDEASLARNNLVVLLKEYLNTIGLDVDWDDIKAASDESLAVSLAMMCPFEPREKQAILESETLRDRLNMITAFIEMSRLKRDTFKPWMPN